MWILEKTVSVPKPGFFAKKLADRTVFKTRPPFLPPPWYGEFCTPWITEKLFEVFKYTQGLQNWSNKSKISDFKCDNSPALRRRDHVFCGSKFHLLVELSSIPSPPDRNPGGSSTCGIAGAFQFDPLVYPGSPGNRKLQSLNWEEQDKNKCWHLQFRPYGRAAICAGHVFCQQIEGVSSTWHLGCYILSRWGTWVHLTSIHTISIQKWWLSRPNIFKVIYYSYIRWGTAKSFQIRPCQYWNIWLWGPSL